MNSFFSHSDEDTDTRALVKSWLKRNAPDNKMLEGWLEDYFYKAVDLVTNQLDLIVPTTLVGVISGGLSHLRSVNSRGEFACAVIRGLGGNLNESSKETLAKEVGIRKAYNQNLLLISTLLTTD